MIPAVALMLATRRQALLAAAASVLGARVAAGGPLPSAASLPPFPVTPGALKALGGWHTEFPGGRRWRLTLNGVESEGKAALTLADDAAYRAWVWFGPEMVSASVEFAVPLELLLATAATETVAGSASAKQAAGARGSSGEVGLMQTLPATARMALGKPGLPAKALLDPLTSIRAGAAYIASQFAETGYDPPLVAAGYNAGGVYENRGDKNPWRMRCYPIGTGQHITRFVGHFGDGLLLTGARLDRTGRAHCFARALRA